MSQLPSSPFRLGPGPQNNPFAKAVKATNASIAATPVSTAAGRNPKGYNPFMTGLNTESQAFKDNYGVNKPLKEAMFLGYRDEQPIFAGSRLFILY